MARVVNVGLACCAVEVIAATIARGEEEIPGLGDLDVLVVAGTVTTALAPKVKAMYDERPGCRVVAFGACAMTGGPYWDSYAVVQGIDRVVPVDVYVPGCPPRPEALLAGLRELVP